MSMMLLMISTMIDSPSKVGDKVGIMRKSDNTLHFFLNGADLGVAASNIPEVVFGVVDLYGAAIKATVCGDDLPIDAEDDVNEASNVSSVNQSKYNAFSSILVSSSQFTKNLMLLFSSKFFELTFQDGTFRNCNEVYLLNLPRFTKKEIINSSNITVGI